MIASHVTLCRGSNMTGCFYLYISIEFLDIEVTEIYLMTNTAVKKLTKKYEYRGLTILRK